MENEDKENEGLEEASDEILRRKLGDINFNSFLKAISDSPEDIHSFEAFVDISEFRGESSRQKAVELRAERRDTRVKQVDST